MARALIIAYTTYIHDARVRRHAEALAARGHQVDVISIAAGEPPQLAGVNLIGIGTPRYRGSSRSRYLLAYAGFFARAAMVAMLPRLISNSKRDEADQLAGQPKLF